jgi:hypothetical protein
MTCTRKLPGRSKTMLTCPALTSTRVVSVTGSSSTADAEPRLDSCSVSRAMNATRFVLRVAVAHEL